jgi:hypothetical protein
MSSLFRLAAGRILIPASSIPNSLHVLEQHLLAAPVIEFCGPAVDVAGDSLGGFQGAIISRKFVIPVARNE